MKCQEMYVNINLLTFDQVLYETDLFQLRQSRLTGYFKMDNFIVQKQIYYENYFVLTKHALLKIVSSQKISHLRQNESNGLTQTT